MSNVVYVPLSSLIGIDKMLIAGVLIGEFLFAFYIYWAKEK